jgi:hypothetical protein
VFFLDFYLYRTNQASGGQSVKACAFLGTYLVRLPTSGLLARNNFRLHRENEAARRRTLRVK